MMSKNSIVPFLKDYLINYLIRPFLLDTNELHYNHLLVQNWDYHLYTIDFIKEKSDAFRLLINV